MITVSRLRDELKWKYRRIKAAHARETIVEYLWLVGTILLAALVVAYFGSHFMLWITGYYDQTEFLILTK